MISVAELQFERQKGAKGEKLNSTVVIRSDTKTTFKKNNKKTAKNVSRLVLIHDFVFGYRWVKVG